jgi:hypothetical protein
MSRLGRTSLRTVWVTLLFAGMLFCNTGCGRGMQPVAQKISESEPSSDSSTQPNAPTATDSPTIEIGDYENDPDYTPYSEHYTDGRTKLEGGFRNGQRHGVWTYYRSFNGNIMRVERYRDGELLSMGTE